MNSDDNQPNHDKLPAPYAGYMEVSAPVERTMIWENGSLKCLCTCIGEQGIRVGFKIDADLIPSYDTYFREASGLVRQIRENLSLPEPPPVIHFMTSSFFVAQLGPAHRNSVSLICISPTGQTYQTEFGLGAVSQLRGTFGAILERFPHVPVIDPVSRHVDGMATPGGDGTLDDSAEFFGQSYPRDVLQSLGVLSVRANLLDRALLVLYAAVRDEEVSACEADFYVIRNLDRRFAMVRAAIVAAKFDEDVRKVAVRAIKRGRAAAVRRNLLVHGEWSFDEGALNVSTTKSNKRENKRVDARMIDEVTMAYNDAAALLAAAAGAVLPPTHDDYSIRAIVPSRIDAELASISAEMRRRAELINESLGFPRRGDSDGEE